MTRSRTKRTCATSFTREDRRSERENDERYERNLASAVSSSATLDLVRLRVRGIVFEIAKATLLRVKGHSSVNFSHLEDGNQTQMVPFFDDLQCGDRNQPREHYARSTIA